MATPTASTTSKRPIGSVSTPSHLNFNQSPPRSVPSPVTARHPAGKTPVNHSTTSSSHSQGSKTLSGTPMVPSLSQTGVTSSPFAPMLGFNTPNGLGIEGATPAGLNLHTPALGATSMVPTMSELGLTASGAKRNEDDERRAKMRKVLKRIGKPKGRVSEEGIARISRRVGFANDIDAEKLTREEKERKVGNRPISTAGNTIVIEIDLKNQVPQSVQVAYSVQSKALEEQGANAGQVLLDDLKAPDGIALNAKLDRFASNLETLARMDRLSISGVNCFEALSGIYTSLRRLYEQEKQAMSSLHRTNVANAESDADTEVMCKKSGKPLMHAHGKLGLEILYWRESRHLTEQTNFELDDTKMDIDEPQGETSTLQSDEDQIFSLRIEAQASPASLYPPVRTSETWVSDPLELPTADSGVGIPWQDPPPTFVTANGTGDAMAVDGQQKMPDLRWIAKLDPPLVMPWQTAMNVLNSVGVSTPPMLGYPPQYPALLLNPDLPPLAHPQTTSFSTSAEQTMLSQKSGKETTVCHKYNLESVKLDWGYRIDELPFSHPRQLVELLPTLRQWACIGSLLRATFKSNFQLSKKEPAANGTTHIHGDTGHSKLHDLLQLEDLEPFEERVPISFALGSTPTPTLGVTFPTVDHERITNISVQVLPNADFAVIDNEVIGTGQGTRTTEESQKLAQALDSCGDLGVWLEWLRTRSTS